MASVSKHIRDTIVTLLADETVGFNATLATIAQSYNVKPFSLDFTGNSRNFFQGYYTAKDLVESTNLKKGPFACLYTIKSQNTNDQKFVTFSGSVLVGIDTYITFPQSAALSNTDDLTDAVEATYYTMFNSAANYSFYGDVQYNGDLLATRGPVAMGLPNWVQLMQCRVSFDLLAQ
jgi:hypothetical protein